MNGNAQNLEKHRRPTRCLISFSKLYERMKNRLIEFLEANIFMDSDQHGFRVDRSVFSAGIELIESVIDSLDKGE